ncbi:hypothetical protein [Sulfurimonas sp. RIFOXYB12_FULL_35_9]|jgi:hypothetical protein|uniref:hypothetical protein n=1 Tax=Sulfurimonas sp. RIFOXYB12_FULL_35_9 TaxID=1802256 RepID=UPI0008D0583B|nr:hypothetical protein [Sulfurimonas sp. RIFOXYB12_FULL_35_9]MBS4067725.1 hypothetical protein [Sulfurimonas sp.]OHE05464.1 MAG: hypothetical protein A2345_02570 [Sulfurimonas sp. RIFOXYB12_FULL_35_9]
MEEEKRALNIDCNRDIKTLITLEYLRDLECGLIAALFKSEENRQKILSSLVTDDFTFFPNTTLFTSLQCDPNKFDDFDSYVNAHIDQVLSLFGKNVSRADLLYVVQSKPSENIELDIAELTHFSNSRKSEDILDKPRHRVIIEESKGSYDAVYVDNRLFSIVSSNIEYLPPELQDVFMDTFITVLKHVDTPNYDVSMDLDETERNLQGVTLIKRV